MKKHAIKAAAVAAVCMVLSSAPANANTLDFLWQWTGTELHGITTEDGSVIQDSIVGTSYTGSYGLWNSQTV
jgi:hypothetical protein